MPGPDGSPPARVKWVAHPHLVVRTPLLPLETLADWPREPAAARRRLAALLERPEVREAIGIAAPAVLEGIARWQAEPDSDRGKKLEKALHGYVQRLASRCTPFGLFAGVSLARLGSTTRLELAPHGQARRKTRVDLGVLFQLCEQLVKRPDVREAVRFHPNETAVAVGDRLHFVTGRQDGEQRVYELSSVARGEAVSAALGACRQGARLHAVREQVARLQVGSEAEVAAFVEQLVDAQVLLPELRPVLTGSDALDELTAQLERAHVAPETLAQLAALRRELEVLDGAPPGAGYPQHRAVAARVAELGVRSENGRALQVDLFRPAPHAEVSAGLIQGLLNAAARLSAVLEVPRSPLADFKAAFERRWESAEVPLLLALDEEAGIGLLKGGVPLAENPLLREVALGDPDAEHTASGAQALGQWRSGLWLEAQRLPEPQVELDARDLDARASGRAPPQSFRVMARLFAPRRPDEPLGQLVSFDGGLPESLNGRFCWLDPKLKEAVASAIAAHEARDSERVFAEVVHSPEGRVGNVIARPLLRGYELPVLARSGAPLEQQLELADLLLSLRNGRLVLRSKRLGREVVPALSNAHNFNRGLPLYRFLALLGREPYAAAPAWSWGPLEHAPALPRVTLNRWVVSPARYRLTPATLRTLKAPADLAALGAQLRWPRHLLSMEGDNAVPVDLQSESSCAAFLDAHREREAVELQEDLQRRYGSPVESGGAALANELVFSGYSETPSAPVSRRAATEVTRSFGPGDEWLFARVTVAVASADRLLTELLKPLLDELHAEPRFKGWFFVRYTDPDHHLRLRFRGEPAFLLGELWPRLHASFEYARGAGLIAREELGTYVREVERYGGPAVIGAAEAMFEADSRAVLELLELAPGSAGLELRWRWALLAIVDLFAALELTPAQRRATLSGWRRALARELGDPERLEPSLSKKYRSLKRELEQLLSQRTASGPLARGLEVLNRRAQALHALAAPLRQADPGALTAPLEDIAGALMHLSCNRLLRSNQRANELVLYDLLLRHLRSA
ncbi:MAG: lantibiotic dehydratase [Archangiaceae bacterium]|nr:lantibiotic dehydratase [Archangiaceae bacterium]